MASTARSLQKIFVGNIPWSVGHQELRDFFKQFGRIVSANVVYDKSTGCSKGFGFVVFANSEPLSKLESNSRLLLEGNYLSLQPQNDVIDD